MSLHSGALFCRTAQFDRAQAWELFRNVGEDRCVEAAMERTDLRSGDPKAYFPGTIVPEDGCPLTTGPLTASSKRRDIPALTGIRGAAALWVFVYHIYKSFAGDGAGLFDNEAVPFLREGWRGVDLVFILSGFVIAYVHIGEFKTIGLARLRSYASRRFWRVYPLNAFWHAAIVLIFVAAPAVLTLQARYNPTSTSPTAFVYALLLIQSWVPGFSSAWNWPAWSLSAEIAAYLLFPLIAVGANRIVRPSTAWVAAGAAILALGCLLYARGVLSINAVSNYNAILRSVFCFAAGVAMCRATALGTVSARTANLLALAGLGLGVLGCAGGSWSYLWVPASALLIAAAASGDEGVAAKVLSTGPMKRLGDVSFSLYLSHWPVILVLRAWLIERKPQGGVAGSGVALLLAVSTTATVTYLSWRYLESPLHRLGRKISKRELQPAS